MGIFDNLQKKIDEPKKQTTEERLAHLAGRRGRIIRRMVTVIVVVVPLAVVMGYLLGRCFGG